MFGEEIQLTFNSQSNQIICKYHFPPYEYVTKDQYLLKQCRRCKKVISLTIKGRSSVRFPKYYTVEEWKGYDFTAERVNDEDITMQEILCNTYEVFLTDYNKENLGSRKERFDRAFDNFILKLNIGIEKFNKFMDQFSKSMNSFSLAAGASQKGIKQKDYGLILGKGHGSMDYGFLTGKKEKKLKKRKKVRKDKKKRRRTRDADKSVTDTRDFSGLTSHRDSSGLLGKGKIKIR